MSLFLPILLLGFAQPADQPVALPAQPQTQAQSIMPATSLDQMDEASRSQSGQPGQSQQFKHMDPIEIYPSESSDVCFTIRSYYFTPQDDRGLKPDGMTICESGRDMAKRNAKKDHNPRFLPLATPQNGVEHEGHEGH